MAHWQTKFDNHLRLVPLPPMFSRTAFSQLNNSGSSDYHRERATLLAHCRLIWQGVDHYRLPRVPYLNYLRSGHSYWENPLILLLGASGYIGTAFDSFFRERGIDFTPVSRAVCNYYDSEQLIRFIEANRAEFLINCAGYTGTPNVDACETNKAECLMANAVLPSLISTACSTAGIAWGHVSSGCIFTGLKQNAHSEPAHPGFNEQDIPNFTFRQNNCSFYSGCKALGEECLDDAGSCYIWRLRIPFNEQAHRKNYLSKIMSYDRLLDVRNSLTHLTQFVEACFQCWVTNAAFGVYHMTNSGSVTTREVAEIVCAAGLSHREFQFFDDETEFMNQAAKAPRSHTVLDNSKAIAAGLPFTSVAEALEDAVRNWRRDEPST